MDYEKYRQEQIQREVNMRNALGDMVKELPLTLNMSEEIDPIFGIPKNEVTLIKSIADRYRNISLDLRHIE